MSVKRTKDVLGTIEFRKFFNRLPENESRKKELIETFKILKENCLRGDRIPYELWPRSYIKKYNITNLWRLPLRSGWRLIYTIIGEDNDFIVCVLEVFSHSEYEKRFGY